MPKHFDATSKELLEAYPEAWMAYIGRMPEGPVGIVDADLSTVTADADKVYRVGGPQPYLVHLEIQVNADKTMPRRLLRYNAMLDMRHDLRVLSALVLLRPEADAKSLTGVLDHRLPAGERVLEFHYRVIRAWEQPVEPILAGDVGTLPLALLADVPRPEAPNVLDRIDRRLKAETPPATAVTIMASTLLFAGLKFEKNEIAALRRRLQTMNITTESSYYRLLVEEARIKEAQDVMLHLGRIRFGPPDEPTRQAIESLQDLDRLKRLHERLLTASNWSELLAED
ncbi:MAG TPA: hypothetical protein VGY53_05765 [Isosphaeraceae bacterium]|nr:hypothetical protein [Isosphaeraceae bacterium]